MEKNEVGRKSSNISVGRIVMNTIRKYDASNGISLPQLKKVLRETKKLDVALHNSEIKLALKNAMDRGILSREGGSYRVVNTNVRAKNPSKDAKTMRGTKKINIKILKDNSSGLKMNATVRVKNSSKDAKTTRRTKKELIKILKDNSSSLKMNANVRVKKSPKDAKTTRRTKKEPIMIHKVNSLSLNAGPDSGSGLEVGDIGVTEDAIVRATEEDANVRAAEEDVTMRTTEEDVTMRTTEEDVTMRGAEEDVTMRAAEEDVTMRAAEEDAIMRATEEDINSPLLRGNDNQDDVQKQNSEEQE